jgi:hypothetical protein
MLPSYTAMHKIAGFFHSGLEPPGRIAQRELNVCKFDGGFAQS